MFNLQEEFFAADQRRIREEARESDNLKQAKRQLHEIAREAKKEFLTDRITDRPAVRMIINDSAHSIGENQGLTDDEADSLHDLAASLHP